MEQDVKKYGVDLVKKAIKFIYDATDEVAKDLEDKHLSFSEILGLGDNLYSGIKLATNGSELLNELKDIDTEEGVELAEYVGSLIKDATNDDIDLIIENAIEAIKGEVEIYNKNIIPIVETIKKLKNK